MTGPMRAITIRQPWAQCIAVGAKQVENRGRWTSYRGEVAIHAGASRDVAGDQDPRVTALWGRDPSIGLPFRAVVAVAELTDCHAAVQRFDGTSCCGVWGDARYGDVPGWHLVLADVVALDRPVPVGRGRLAVPWAMGAEDSVRVRAVLAATKAEAWRRWNDDINWQGPQWLRDHLARGKGIPA